MELVERIAALGPQFSERAGQYDRDATFPAENWKDLADEGFLGLCAPKESGGLGGDFVAYALVSEELGGTARLQRLLSICTQQRRYLLDG